MSTGNGKQQQTNKQPAKEDRQKVFQLCYEYIQTNYPGGFQEFVMATQMYQDVLGLMENLRVKLNALTEERDAAKRQADLYKQDAESARQALQEEPADESDEYDEDEYDVQLAANLELVRQVKELKEKLAVQEAANRQLVQQVHVVHTHSEKDTWDVSQMFNGVRPKPDTKSDAGRRLWGAKEDTRLGEYTNGGDEPTTPPKMQVIERTPDAPTKHRSDTGTGTKAYNGRRGKISFTDGTFTSGSNSDGVW